MRRLALAAGGAASLFVAAAAAGSAFEPEQGVANPMQGRPLYVHPATDARRQAAAWQRSRPDDAARMLRIASQPHAIWLGEWDGDVRQVTETHSRNAEGARSLPVFVAYNIPYRDCGLHSRGGARNGSEYRRWIIGLARGLGGRPAVVVLEPDAIAAIDCLPARLADERYALIAEAASVLTTAGAIVYIDAGNANWQQPGEIARRLTRAGIASAQGFALNVSNFHATDPNVQYGARVSQLVGGKHYVIDTSRNGRGAQVEREW
ncbi:MAG: glycoside hydrolase family 6 protein, partial [Gemmatimonadaceae bacterium]|nr:glycoside hydrolase family 6 protein [Gemmatimonadaceae bacterium]